MDESTQPASWPRLSRAPDGSVRLQTAADAAPVDGCTVARCFPWSVPDAYFSVRDKEGVERYLAPSLSDLEPESRRVAEEELAGIERPLQILAVRAVDDRFDIGVWQVDTERGAIEFQVRHEEDIRAVGGGRVVIRDHRGVVFVIPDLAALDTRSRQFVDDRCG